MGAHAENNYPLDSAQRAVEESVVAVLRDVFDPEIPVNIYDLGLIYNIEVTPENSVNVKMTLTSPACPVAGSLPPEVEQKIKTIASVNEVKVEVVWDPPWDQGKMTDDAKLQLNLL